MIKPTRLFTPYLILVLIMPFILLSPLLLTGKAMFWGTVSLQFLPWHDLAFQIISQGQMPLWNPLVGMGAPLAANYQSALFYPPTWLVLFLEGLGGVGWAAWGQTLLVALHMSWAALGMAVLARRLGLGILAQAVCGLAYSLSGYLVARSGFLSINAAASWVPWIIFAATDVAIERASLWNIAKLSIFLGLQFLSGHAQTAWYTILLIFAWAGYWGWRTAHSHLSERDHARIHTAEWRSGILGLLRAWFGVIVALLIGGMLAAVQLLPTTELLLQSQRANAVEFNFAMTYSFWPWRLLTLFAPNIFGSPVSDNYWGYGYYWEDALYIGLLPIVVAILLICSVVWVSLKNKKHEIKDKYPLDSRLIDAKFIYFLLGLILISFVFALGKNTPIFPWLYQNIPTFSLFQAPARFSIWAEFGLVLLAGIGIDRWRRPSGRALYWTRLATAGSAAICIGSGLTWYLLGTVSPTFIQATAIMGAVGVCIGVLSLLAPDRNHSDVTARTESNYWSWGVLLVLSADLLIAHWGLNPGINQAYYTFRSPNASQIRALSGGNRIYLPAADEYSLKYDRFMRSDKYSISESWLDLRDVFLPDLNILDGISSVNNFDPLLPARYVTWMEKLNQLQADSGNPDYQRMLDVMGVGVVERQDNSQKLGVSFLPVSPGKRLRWVPCAQFVQSSLQAWNSIFNSQIDMTQQVILEGRIDARLDCPQNSLPGTIHWFTETPNRIVAQVDSPTAGWLVLSDVWYPGWQAEVDGLSTPIERANYLFRAVKVPAGMHQITFFYRPLSYWSGLVISLVAWIGLLIGLFLYRNHHKSQSLD